MTQPAAIQSVRRSVTVEVPVQLAFEVFTARFGSWWPRSHHIGPSDMADFVVEPRVGGRWYEVGVDGTECDSGRVTAFEPPHRLVLAWHLDAGFRYDPDPAHASEVEVRFIAESPARTRVELEHRGFERHGDGASGVQGVVDSPQGWGYCLDLFASAAAAA